MKLTILGSGGCIPIPKPLCQCKICNEARKKGVPYSRTGPSAFLHDINLLIDTPPQIFDSINNVNLKQVDYLLYTHLDADHFDGNSALISFYFDGTKYLDKPQKTINLIVPPKVEEKFKSIKSQYGSLYDFFTKYGVLKKKQFNTSIKIKDVTITPIFVEGNPATAYIYLIQNAEGKKILYAPCDTKPFPINSKHVYDADIFITQTGFFETGLKDGFVYPVKDFTRVELFSFDETLELAKKIRAKKVIFMHLEEYWNRSYDDYKKLEKKYKNVKFAYDGMTIDI